MQDITDPACRDQISKLPEEVLNLSVLMFLEPKSLLKTREVSPFFKTCSDETVNQILKFYLRTYDHLDDNLDESDEDVKSCMSGGARKHKKLSYMTSPKLALVGGGSIILGQDSYKRVDVLDLKSHEWTQRSPMKQSHGTFTTEALSWRGGLVSLSGDKQDSIGTVEMYDASTNRWSSLPCIPLELQYSASACTNDSFYIDAEEIALALEQQQQQQQQQQLLLNSDGNKNDNKVIGLRHSRSLSTLATASASVSVLRSPSLYRNSSSSSSSTNSLSSVHSHHSTLNVSDGLVQTGQDDVWKELSRIHSSSSLGSLSSLLQEQENTTVQEKDVTVLGKGGNLFVTGGLNHSDGGCTDRVFCFSGSQLPSELAKGGGRGRGRGRGKQTGLSLTELTGGGLDIDDDSESESESVNGSGSTGSAIDDTDRDDQNSSSSDDSTAGSEWTELPSLHSCRFGHALCYVSPSLKSKYSQNQIDNSSNFSTNQTQGGNANRTFLPRAPHGSLSRSRSANSLLLKSSTSISYGSLSNHYTSGYKPSLVRSNSTNSTTSLGSSGVSGKPAPPFINTGHTADGGSLWVIGGQTVHITTIVSDSGSDSEDSSSDEPPSTTQTQTQTQSSVSSYISTNSTEWFDFTTCLWRRGPDMLEQRVWGSVVQVGRSLYAVGGDCDEYGTALMPSIEKLDLDLWEAYVRELDAIDAISAIGDFEREKGCAFAFAEFAEEKESLNRCKSAKKVKALPTPVKPSWEAVTTFPKARKVYSSTVIGSSICVVGGRGGDYSNANDFQCYDTCGDQWSVETGAYPDFLHGSNEHLYTNCSPCLPTNEQQKNIEGEERGEGEDNREFPRENFIGGQAVPFSMVPLRWRL